MLITMNYWSIVIKTNVNTGGSLIDFEVTEEQFQRIEESYKTGKFEYMTDDPELKDIIALFYNEAYEPELEEYGEIAKELKIVFEYPEEIKS